MTTYQYTGPERRKPIKRQHWTYRIFLLWIICFTAFTVYTWNNQRNTIADLKKAKVSVSELQKTNCGLASFLMAARNARSEAASKESGTKKANDLRAVKAYNALINEFITGCPKFNDKGGHKN